MLFEAVAELIKRAHQLEIVQKGSFRLASGQISDYYIDGRKLALDSHGLLLIGQLIYGALDKDIVAVGGPATGAISLVAATLTEAAQQQRELNGFYMRQATKDHGQLKNIEGDVKSPVALVDDTCTTGGSLLKIAQQLKEEGIVVQTIITIFDRGGGQNVIKAGYPYISFISASEGDLQAYQES